MKPFFFIIFILTLNINLIAQDEFLCKEILSRPTSNSVTIHAIPANETEIYIEYGTDSLNLEYQTTKQTASSSDPYIFEISGLIPDTKYYYKMKCRQIDGTDFISRGTHFFSTQKKAGTTFRFDLGADPHLDSNSIPEAYALTLLNILKDEPDFMIDLGDNFMCEKLSDKSQKNITDRHLLLSSFYEQICHSVPLYLVLGNHEGEWGTLTDNNAKSLSIMASNTRKFYFANPEPNNFYSGNSKSEPQVGLRQNYFAWEWGSALFIVLDPYWYTNPKTGWGMTLGEEQYNWFKSILKTSTSKLKFVFCHNLVGGANKDMRGGVEAADFYEWGGKDTNNVWTFDKNRPGWDKPIHQLMVENGVNIFFHGHDHFYGYQEKDGIIYQEVPQPSNRNLTNLAAGSYGYINGTLLPGRGYLRITVTDTNAKVEYVKTLLSNEEKGQAKNGDIAHSYIVKPKLTEVKENIFNSEPAISISPNPSINEISIRGFVNECLSVSIGIYEMNSGKLIKRFDSIVPFNGQYDIKWQYETLPSGIYLCRMNACNYTRSTKFIINK